MVCFGFCLLLIGCGQDRLNSKRLQMGYKSCMYKHLKDKKAITYSNVNCIDIEVSNTSIKEHYVTPVKFLKLCPDAEELIGTINKLIFFKDKIILLDKLTNTVFLLNEDGSFNTKIHNIGKANGEFIKIGDICLDEDNQLIIIKDVQLKKVLYYDFMGQFVKAIRTPIWAKEFAQMENGGFCLLTLGNNFSGYRVLFTDSLHQLASKSLPSKYRYKLNFFSHSLMHRREDNICFSYPFSNSFFGANKDSIWLKYHLNFGKNGFRYIPEKHTTFNDFDVDRKDLWFSLGGFIENEKYALFSLNRGSIGATCIWSKEFHHSQLYNFKLKDSFIIPFSRNIHNGYFVSVIPSEWLVRYKNELTKEYGLEAFYDEFSENSNPVLLYFKLEL